MKKRAENCEINLWKLGVEVYTRTPDAVYEYCDRFRGVTMKDKE